MVTSAKIILRRRASPWFSIVQQLQPAGIEQDGGAFGGAGAVQKFGAKAGRLCGTAEAAAIDTHKRDPDTASDFVAFRCADEFDRRVLRDGDVMIEHGEVDRFHVPLAEAGGGGAAT